LKDITIYAEGKIEDSTQEVEIELKKFYEYDNSNLFKMAIYQIGCIIIAPLIIAPLIGKLY
jgi:hypothetical protein